MDIQLENFTTDEKARLLMEIEIERQMRARQQVNLVLPKSREMAATQKEKWTLRHGSIWQRHILMIITQDSLNLR